MQYIHLFNNTNKYYEARKTDYKEPWLSFVDDIKRCNYNKTETEKLFVDLNLPSGNLWCIKNIGANTVEDLGNYYRWGDINSCDNSSSTNNWAHYIYSTSDGTITKYNTTDGLYLLETSDDIAYVSLSKYISDLYYPCIPTPDDFNELIQNCNRTYNRSDDTGINGSGQIYTSKLSSNFIYMPNTNDIDCYLWTSTTAVGAEFEKYAIQYQWDDDYSRTGAVRISNSFKYYAYCIRPILKRLS
ncbi:MAG: hypothetical protein IJH39_12815 [Clostridia bacterium]|nr:hypothetical protein [Clostridia bacterium]